MSRHPPLEPPDSHCLRAAAGWLGLGNPREAQAELDAIRPEFQPHPDVLDVRWVVCAGLNDWPAAVRVADQLLAIAPDLPSGWLHRSFALRRLPEGGGVEAAWKALLPAYAQFPEERIIPYNLSCYACLLGKLDEARDWFHRALKLGDAPNIRDMALADPDLEPLWPEIQKLELPTGKTPD